MTADDETSSMTRRGVICSLLAIPSVAVLSSPCVAEAVGGDALLVVKITAELVAANRILDNQGVLDAFGHVSCRHPTRPERFLLSASRAPGLVEAADIMEFYADGTPVDARGRSPYVERYIHAAIYAARPDVKSVIHDHSYDVIPFSVSKTPLRPIANNGGFFGNAVPVWDMREKFGPDTGNIVTSLVAGQDLARKLGPAAAVLMRGHGAVVVAPSIRLAVSLAINLSLSASMELKARSLEGPINFLSPGEIKATSRMLDARAPGGGVSRAWEYWCKKAAVPFTPDEF